MIAVVYDLELVKRFKKGQLSEIIEIGACKVDLTSLKIIDDIQIYMLPKNGYIPKSSRKFINMTQDDVKSAIPFSDGMKKFIFWLQKEEDYFLCSWGKDDKVHFIDQCLRNNMKLKWFKNYNDIQPQIGKALKQNTKNQLGLKNALHLANIEPVGQAHRGIDDTINTALLLIKYFDEVTLRTNMITEKELNLFESKRKKRRNRPHSKSEKQIKHIHSTDKI
ncbi:3'-5' exonuclease [Evansella cellulosilytica]|uniref:Exonuclease RNase T and DNA polymerase III n=1 Tax=Evansella cellulosilytica (strain ATCC 21833 / DSM 2522 / FERM P-1141 / JCM 9156 / N-4) TaxID=649639 RepID=E6TQH9_EVAC2|nr:3'-5' exonuclease [Evansella cellulosilytica]ADU30490.1 Exonuclease RNase T and DNA polymerase III [Evansella cellulosilytica DSM 2522]